ncbi:hypothetical protein [Prosthecobacter sp.]|uniref:hypothetical protein n=1 Tax=Prosthecobacter sp. TaxID=1965333 RepID=UPI003904D356
MTIGKTFSLLIWAAIIISLLPFFTPNGPFQTSLRMEEALLESRKAASPTGHLCALCNRDAVHSCMYSLNKTAPASQGIQIWFCGDCKPPATAPKSFGTLTNDDSKWWFHNLLAVFLFWILWNAARTIQNEYWGQQKHTTSVLLMNIAWGFFAVATALLYCLGIWK